MTISGIDIFILLCILSATIQSAVSVSRPRPRGIIDNLVSLDDPVPTDGECFCVFPEECPSQSSSRPDSSAHSSSETSQCESPKVCCETTEPSWNEPLPPTDGGSSQLPPASIDQTSGSHQLAAGGACGVQRVSSGRSSQQIRSRIFSMSDDSTQVGEFPWMVAVTDSSGTFHFGGSLIRPDFVLTAAHRVSGKNPADLKVRVGQHDLDTAEGYQERGVSRIIVHEGYKPKTFAFDVALLELSSPVDMTDPNVGTICLPYQDENLTTKNCIVTGWGYNNARKMQRTLRQVNLGSILSHETCNSALARSLGYSLDHSLICAGGKKGEDSCWGDGGGPLVCPIDDSPEGRYFIQLGVVAAGIGCGNEYPGVYANVASVSDWIDSNLKESSSSSPSSSPSFSPSPPSSALPVKEKTVSKPPSRARPSS